MAIQQMLLGLGGEVIISASDGDTNINLSTVFGSNYTSAVPKRYKVASGIEIGASFGNNVITIPSGMAGTLTLDIDGTVTGAGGTADNNGGDAIYIASSGVTIENSGTIRAGGGAGGDGGAGGTGGNGTATTTGAATGNSNGNCSVTYNDGNGHGDWLSPVTSGQHTRDGDQLCQHCHGSQYYAVSQGSSSLSFYQLGGAGGGNYQWGTSHPLGRVWSNHGRWQFHNQGCNQITTSATSGGAGGAGGAGGVGQGYNQSATNGSSGASGSAGGTNAGTGGTGGTGGNGGAYGANGTNGATGSAGSNGNSTNGASGASGVSGHLAGYYLKHASSISSTMNNTGTLTGSLG